MPRNSQSFIYSAYVASRYLVTAISITNTSVFPVRNTQAASITQVVVNESGTGNTITTNDATLLFTEVRYAIAETMSRIIRRDQDTNGILGTIATGRIKLKQITKDIAT